MLLNFSFCVLLSWFCRIIFPCFLAAHWASLQQLFSVLYGANHRSPCLWVRLLEDYCDPFVMLFPWLFYDLLSSVLLSSHLKMESPPPVFTNSLWGRNTFFQPCQRFWGFLRPMDIPDLHFLLTLMVKFLCLYSFSPSGNILPDQVLTAYLLLPKGGVTAQVCSLSLACRYRSAKACFHCCLW